MRNEFLLYLAVKFSVPKSTSFVMSAVETTDKIFKSYELTSQ